jgi:hypothetical protein
MGLQVWGSWADSGQTSCYFGHFDQNYSKPENAWPKTCQASRFYQKLTTGQADYCIGHTPCILCWNVLHVQRATESEHQRDICSVQRWSQDDLVKGGGSASSGVEWLELCQSCAQPGHQQGRHEALGRCSVIGWLWHDKRISYRMDFLKNEARTIFFLFI